MVGSVQHQFDREHRSGLVVADRGLTRSRVTADRLQQPDGERRREPGKSCAVACQSVASSNPPAPVPDSCQPSSLLSPCTDHSKIGSADALWRPWVPRGPLPPSGEQRAVGWLTGELAGCAGAEPVEGDCVDAGAGARGHVD
jgi:hypothetical protein